MKVSEAIEKAVDQGNGKAAGRIAGYLRFKYGLDYEAIRGMFQRLRPALTAPQFDALMYEGDRSL